MFVLEANNNNNNDVDINDNSNNIIISSCRQQWVRIIIYKSLDKSKAIKTTFLSLAKAFDVVDHSILQDKF